MAEAGGAALSPGYLGRGLATGDFDNDGFIDAAFIDLIRVPCCSATPRRRQTTGSAFNSKERKAIAMQSALVSSYSKAAEARPDG